MTERWYFGEDPVSSVFAGDVRLYPTTPPQDQIEFPIIIDGAIYQNDDLHVFASNGKDVKWPSQATPIFVAVNGYKATDYDNPTVEPGDRIYALFDWDNSSQKPQDWYYDILQIGSIASSVLTQPRQLANGAYAFTEMSANPKVLADLDTSNLTNMEGMFKNSEFDVDIAGWNTTNVTNMDNMFNGAVEFSQDISFWCVSNIPAKPVGFSDGAINWSEEKEPLWGTCVSLPDVFPIEIDGKTYSYKDAHVFVANGIEVKIPQLNNELPIFVAVNGVDVTPTSFVTRTVEVEEIGEDGERTTSSEEIQTTAIDANDGDIIHAIFDWNNDKNRNQDWYSDILQIGSRSVGGEPKGYVNPPALPSGRIPNQLKVGKRCFHRMEYANPKCLSDLDISNLKELNYAFAQSKVFNRDISNWDLSNVKNLFNTWSQASVVAPGIGNWDLTSVTSLSNTFSDCIADIPDITNWNVSNVNNMYWMFSGASNFNQDISGWNVSSVKHTNADGMDCMFRNATSFNQDLSEWCVILVDSAHNFDDGATAWTKPKPVWGTCPRGENIQLPDGVLPEEYELEDCHIFVANGNEVYLPIFANETGPCPAVFVAVDGVEVTPTLKQQTNERRYYWTVPANENQNIHAIFDWYNTNWLDQNWFSDILQFGLNSETKQRNQLKSGYRAFYGMTANPAKIPNLDISNLTNMEYMFSGASSFNSDISGWDVSNVTNMLAMFAWAEYFNQDIGGWNVSNVTNMERVFYSAKLFDQDLSEWCVSQFDKMPDRFDVGTSTTWTKPKPVWGTCPRFENIFPITGDDGKEYEYRDAHVFIANGETVELPIPSDDPDNCPAVFVAVGGEEVTPIYVNNIPEADIPMEKHWTISAPEGSIIHAIFDWDNVYYADQNWIKDILQFGLNSDTGKRNQLKSAINAFTFIQVSPAAILNLDISNLTHMDYMFASSKFNLDISSWDVSHVTDMYYTFGSSEFNQDISGWDVSNVTNMNGMFSSSTFNKNIGGWDTSNVTDMTSMFSYAASFNQDISGWDTSRVTSMRYMFNYARSFNQDLSEWCVGLIDEMPYNFDRNSGFEGQTAKQPQWGTCPRGENIQLPDGVLPEEYELEDCHIFVANENAVNLPIPNTATPVFVAVDGEKKNYRTQVKGETFPESIIHAIFDWDNSSSVNQNWYSDIIQFGLNSVTGQRNQLKNGKSAFNGMETNPAAISDLNVSNLTIMERMFETASSFNQNIANWDASNVTNMSNMFKGAESFNQNISGWDTHKVVSMNNMFNNATSFNQDLHEWCVLEIVRKPLGFDQGTTLTWTKPKPVWGTCPREEGIINYTWPITIGGKTYEKEDAHIIVCNGKDVKFPIPVGTKPIFVGVNGKTRDPIIVTRTVEMEEIGEDGVTTATSQEIELASIDAIADGDIMEAIFDWDNADKANQDWYSEITQIGLNSVTGKRNQLKTGHYAFASMAANPAVITNLDISNLTDMEGMFYGATRFNKSIFWDTSNVTNMKLMFRSAKAFNSDISKWNTSKVETMEYMFAQTSFNRDISGWDTSNVENMANMFSINSYFTIPIGGWNTSKVQYMNQMFDRASKFNGDISKWDTSNVTNMDRIFSDASSFNQNISGWDTSKVENMNSMFRGTPFNQDISGWDTSSATRMQATFDGATSFNQDLSKWCVSYFDEKPSSFDRDATSWTKPRPVWGTCPRGEDGS